MYGQMPAAPAPRPGGPSAGTVAVRVLMAAGVVLSLGLLAWVAMLRLAIMRRRALDWVLFWTQLAATAGCFVLLQEKYADSWLSDLGAGLILAMGAAVTAHYLAADIRHHRAPAAPGPHPLPHAPAYGYPPVAPAPAHPLPVNPATAVTAPGPYAPQTPQTPPTAPNPYAATPPATLPTPPPTPRIDQVRAELDELSDLLRKEGEK
ncbi:MULTISPECIES: hypothetical protein [unclassified Streptomyces]|uniref:hypothetical protein n=1 Tax=unclassified Streptomyces TaxID=2593676 RepID=UPI0004C3FD58